MDNKTRRTLTEIRFHIRMIDEKIERFIQGHDIDLRSTDPVERLIDAHDVMRVNLDELRGIKSTPGMSLEDSKVETESSVKPSQ